MRSCDVISGAVMGGDDKSSLPRRRREQERRDPSEKQEPGPTHDTRSTRALFQERPRKFKRHHFVQCRVPDTDDEVKEL